MVVGRHPARGSGWEDKWKYSSTLEAGTTLFHGTDRPFSGDAIRLPAWFSREKAVARWFATRYAETGGRVLRYRLTEEVRLPTIQGKGELIEFGERFHVDVRGAETMRNTIEHSAVPGWIIPHNYPQRNGGDDILLCPRRLLCFETEVPIGGEGT